MTAGTGGWSLSTTLGLALGAFGAAMALAGLLAAFFKVKGLEQHGLLEEAQVSRVLRAQLADPRRFEVTVSTLYLAATGASCAAWAQAAAALWDGPLAGRYFAAVVVPLVLSWSLGGLLSKLLAARAALGYARWGAVLLLPLAWLLRPWSALLLWVMDRTDERLWTGDALPPLSTGEIRSLVSEEEGEGALEEEEREMIHSIFGFHDTAVREIMVPRIDMVTVEASDPVEKAVAAVNETLHSRLPVHDGTIDRITGLLYAKDLLALVAGGRLETAGKRVGDLARPAYFIPESKKIDEVLAEFRKGRIHMAIVIDEYGGTAGLVTLEDVLEEIVGEIEDEFDEDERLFTWVDERRLRVDPKIGVEDLQELLGVPLPVEEGSETLAGLVYEAAGKVPEVGDEVRIGELAVAVEAVEEQRILRVLITAPAALPGWAARGDEPA